MSLLGKLKPTSNLAAAMAEIDNDAPTSPAAAPVAAEPAPANPSSVGAPANLHRLHVTETKSALEASAEHASRLSTVEAISNNMTERGIPFWKLTMAQLDEPHMVAQWLESFIHHLPVPGEVVNENAAGGDIGANQVATKEELLSPEGRFAQEQARKRRRESRHNAYWETPLLSDLIRNALPDGSFAYTNPKSNKVAFMERENNLNFADIDFEAIACGIERAQELGWKSLKVNGSPEFMSAVFIEAAKAGLKVDDYDPTPSDLQKLSALNIKPQSVGAAPLAKNSIEGIPSSKKPRGIGL